MTLVSFFGEVVVGLAEPVVVAPLAAGAADPPRRLRSTVVHPPGCFGAGVEGPACMECIREWGGEVRRAIFVVVAGGEEEEVVVTWSRPRFAARGGGPPGSSGGYARRWRPEGRARTVAAVVGGIVQGVSSWWCVVVMGGE